MRFKFIGSILAITMLVCACSKVTVDQEEEGRKLMQLSRDWSAMVGAGQLAESIDLWAEDAVMMPPDLPVLSGKTAIREYVMGAISLPGFKISWEPESAHVSMSGDMAYLIERNVIEFDDQDGGKVVTHGKVVTVWRKDSGGQWRNVVDIWNAVPPPAD